MCGFREPAPIPTLGDVLANVRRFQLQMDQLALDYAEASGEDPRKERMAWDLAFKKLALFLTKLMLWTGVRPDSLLRISWNKELAEYDPVKRVLKYNPLYAGQRKSARVNR